VVITQPQKEKSERERERKRNNSLKKIKNTFPFIFFLGSTRNYERENQQNHSSLCCKIITREREREREGKRK